MLKLFLLLLTSVSIYKGQLDCDLDDSDPFRKTRGGILYEGYGFGQYANFNIDYYSKYKVITNKFTNQEIGLYCKGTRIPENPPNNVKPYIWVEIPLSKIATKSRVGMALLQQLNLNKTTIYASDLESYTTPCAIDGIAQGNIKDIKEVDDSVEILFEDAQKGTDSHTDVQLDGKKVTLSYEGKDLTPMKKLIWLKFVASFFNLEKYVEDKYNSTLTSYNCHQHNLEKIKDKKYIAITKYTDLGNDKGTWEILKNEYYNNLIRSSGGLPVNVEEGLSREFQDVQQFKNQIKYCDVIIDITEFPKESPAALKSWKKLAKIDPNEEHHFKFLNQEKLFSITKLVNENGNLDFEESGIVRPDLVIRDFIATQYPMYNSTYETTWLANLCHLETPKTLTKDQCAKPSYPSISFENGDGCKVYKNGIKKFVDDRTIQYENYELTGEDPIDKPVKNNSFGVGGILGITFGVLLLIGLSAFLAWWIKKRSITKGKPLTIHKLKAFKRPKESDEHGLLHQDED
ncbi:hypothetical protein K502DRAFT_326048 [Neoconidiobolus thromboides FSU 785]|nr:hypothetical protein K502DRAFT_326048 [Neoconidiobolus thromboides FSU 785]